MDPGRQWVCRKLDSPHRSSIIPAPDVPSDIWSIEQFFKSLAENPRAVWLRHALLFSSVVVTWAAAVVCSHDCGVYEGWAVACGVVSICVMVLYHTPLGSSITGLPHKILMALLALWWIAGVVCMTGHSPFTTAGNGFFGSWVSLGAALCLTMDAFEGTWGSGGGGSPFEADDGLHGDHLNTPYMSYAPPVVPPVPDNHDDHESASHEWT